MLTRRSSHGFTMIEILIAVAILSLVLSLGVPSFMVYIQNTKVRNAADAVLNGMQLARSEAIRRNKRVEFQLTSAMKSGWKVRQVNPSEDIQTRTSQEGSDTVTLDTTPGGATTLTFDPMGGRVDNADGSFSLDSVTFLSTTGADTRKLQVQITPSGTVRMCDATPDLSNKDPRKCN
jgi:type IV fimbrial biogenesis protein FimT